jgi:asparagine synthase (glutamine-hydrolysing)
MCGICGIINFDGRPVAEPQLMAMLERMRHRGPDDEGLYRDGACGLGHVRLSILDLSVAGHQPMFSDDGRYVLVYNGEVFNYLELRQELEPHFTFTTQTDTEVVLNAYRRWGEQCLERFNGMFALAIYDTQEKTFFLARDRFGIKPLYYHLDNRRCVFASEIPPLLSVMDGQPEPDEQSIYDFLVYNRTNHTARTFFKGIKKLQHGSTMKIRGRQVSGRTWYRIADRMATEQPLVTVEEFREKLTQAVGLRLRSDVPVGSCLSGGLDSSSLVSIILSHYQKTDLNTFSAVYGQGQHGDESGFIDEYRTLVPHMHFTRPSAESFTHDLETFVTVMEEPVPSTSEYAEFKVFELAKPQVTVVLNGQGADEQMAGYPYFAGFLYKELLRNFHWSSLLREVSHDYRNHRNWQGLEYLAYFLLPTQAKDALHTLRCGFASRDFLRRYRGDNSFLERLYGSPSLHQALMNHFEYKFEHHLIWGDRSSMWFSLEARFPFLDYQFAEMAFRLRNHQILAQGTTKVVLREAMAGLVPEKILARQDKIGYETPEDAWFREPCLREVVQDILHSSRFAQRGYAAAGPVRTLYAQHLAGHKNAAQQIWKCVNLELWFRRFIDQHHLPASGPACSSRRNILYLTHMYNSFEKDQIEYMARFFNQVFVLVRYKPIAELAAVLPLASLRSHRKNMAIDLAGLPDNVTVIPVPLWYLPTDTGYWQLGERHFRAVDRIIRERNLQFDLVHAHFAWTAGYTAVRVKEKYHVPAIVTGHGMDVYDQPFRSPTWRRKIVDVFKRADGIITVSRDNQACLEKLGITREVIVIPNGFRGELFFPKAQEECRRRLALPFGKKIILTVGSLSTVKGHCYLVEAMAQVAPSYPEADCYIVGEGELRGQLERQIAALGLAGRVRLAGAKPHTEINDWMNACDVFVLPSLTEGLPVVQIEAMACGKPVVATRNKGSTELIASDEMGMLCTVADARDLGQALQAALEKTWDRDRIIARSQPYRMETVTQRILALYQEKIPAL